MPPPAGFEQLLTTEEFTATANRGAKYDAIIDPVGGDVRRTGLQALKSQGQLLIVGNVSPDAESLIPSQTVWLNSLLVRGFNLGLLAQVDPTAAQQATTRIMQLVAEGKLTLAPSKIFALSDVADAHAYLESSAAHGQIAPRMR